MPELKLTHIYTIGRSGAIYSAEKVSKFEVCPKCAQPCQTIYDRRKVTIVTLLITKRRFLCKKCQKPFTEPVPGISKWKRTTQRFRSALLWAAENFVDLKRVQRHYRCSRGLVYKVVYEQLEAKRRTRCYDFPSIIGIDEHSFRKPKYEPVEYASVIVDHKGKRIYDLIEGRNKSDLDYAATRFRGSSNVKAVTIDLSSTFKSFVKRTFENARIIADRFHVQRLFSILNATVSLLP